MSLITEEQVELQSIEWFQELGYQYKDGYDIAPEGVNPERDDFRQVILEERLKEWGVNPKDTIVYACGHPGMIEDVNERLEDSEYTFLEERFWKD